MTHWEFTSIFMKVPPPERQTRICLLPCNLDIISFFCLTFELFSRNDEDEVSSEQSGDVADEPLEDEAIQQSTEFLVEVVASWQGSTDRFVHELMCPIGATSKTDFVYGQFSLTAIVTLS